MNFRDPDYQIDPSIFRAYDIRGRAADQLTAQTIYWIGRAIGQRVRTQNSSPVCVGADGRNSGPELKQALICGLRESGADVIDTGFVPTPVVYFAAGQQAVANAVMITASHNPAEQNGLKLILNGQALMDDEIAALRPCGSAFPSGAGKLTEMDYSASYVHQIGQRSTLQRAFKLVVDCANGIAGPTAQKLFKRLNQHCTLLFAEVDGRFPNHTPDPCLDGNLSTLKAEVIRQSADLGIALDGDGDRIVVIDEQGQSVAPDQLLMLLAGAALQQQPDGLILFDTKCSAAVPRHISDLGGRTQIGRTGHSPMKRLMAKTGALAGGELSAHYYFADWYGIDDGLYSSVKLLELLQASDQTLSALVAALPRFQATPELRVAIDDSRKFALVDQLSALAHPDASCNRIDGLRLEFNDGWGLVRASNTEACLVLRFEGESRTVLTRICGYFKQQLTELDPTLDLSLLDPYLCE